MTNISQLEQQLLDIRRAALSAVKQAEAGLQAIGRPVESAVMTREERRKAEHNAALVATIRQAYADRCVIVDELLAAGKLTEREAGAAINEVAAQFGYMMGGDFRYFDTN